MLRIALPSNPDWLQTTTEFLNSCGLSIQQTHTRRYVGTLAPIPDTTVLFQRAADIPVRVEDGTVHLGIAGLDRFSEVHLEDGDGVVILEDLGYSKAKLVIAVPESWIDVVSLSDLAEVALEFRGKGKQLRVATKYPRLVEKHLLSNNITHFILVEAGGTIEAAPAMGYADIIADITSTGATLRENRLKTVQGGTVFTSQASLLGNLRLLKEDQGIMAAVKTLLELVEARLRASTYYSIIANIRGESPEAVANHVRIRPEIAGVQGPTISKVYSKDREPDWYAVTMVVDRDKVMTAVEHLRKIGGNGITVFPTTYVFEDQCQAYQQLLTKLAATPDK